METLSAIRDAMNASTHAANDIRARLDRIRASNAAARAKALANRLF